MACTAEGIPRWWRDPEHLKNEVTEHGGLRSAALAHGASPANVQKAWSEFGLPALPKGPQARKLTLIQGGNTNPEPRKPKRVAAGRRKTSAGLQKLLFIGDPHIPYHSEVGLSIWFAALRDFKPDIVVSTGDFVDCFAVSTYSKDPRRVFHLHGEMEAAGAVLDQINELAPKARRIYLGGNHEDRLQRYLQDKAPELFPFIDIPKLLHLDERGFEYVGYKESTKVGKLNLTHDVGTAGRTAIFKALDAFQSPVVTGHTHRMGYIVEGDATGGTQVSASFGWLGDIAKVDYMHQIRARRDWTLGFGYGYLDASNGYCYLVPVPIVKDTAVVEGRLYTAASARKKVKVAA